MKKKKWLKDIAEIVVAFVAAWLFYQGLAFATGTSTPIVSVASASMFHEQSLDIWWEEHKGYYESVSIDKEAFLRFQNKYGLDVADILVVIKDTDLKTGNIIVYHPQKGCFRIDQTIVHRIVKTENNRYITKGDNNAAPDQCPVEAAQIEGKVVLAVPLFGYPRLALHQIFNI